LLLSSQDVQFYTKKKLQCSVYHFQAKSFNSFLKKKKLNFAAANAVQLRLVEKHFADRHLAGTPWSAVN